MQFRHWLLSTVYYVAKYVPKGNSGAMKWGEGLSEALKESQIAGFFVVIYENNNKKTVKTWTI